MKTIEVFRRWWLAIAILGVIFFLRIYRLSDLLGFYYDQGRDALVIRDFLQNHKLFLLGPTTGIEGIFLGPLYYLTLVPWYALGRGNPVWPAVYIVATTVAALGLIFKLGLEMFGRRTSYIFLLLGGFSYWITVDSRWLANPTQVALAGALTLWGLWKVLSGWQKYWLLIAFGVSVGLQFEAAGAIFFIPAVVVFALWRRELIPRGKILLASLAIFVAMLLPQLFFDFRHEHLLTKSFWRFLIAERSFQMSIQDLVATRLAFFVSTLQGKIFPKAVPLTAVFSWILVFSLWFSRKRPLTAGGKLLMIWVLAPLIGLLFYRGNYGYVWGYYLTGIFLPFLLLVGAVVTSWVKFLPGRVLAAAFLLTFFFVNLPLARSYLSAGVDGPTHITLGNQKQAIKWILEKASDERIAFNVDSYVPPVIPYAYDYLIPWMGQSLGVSLPAASISPRLYTLYEADPPHPERLAAWLERQRGIGVVEEVATFGGVTVERRTRLK